VKAKRVFVVWKHPIFRQSVRLLLDHPDVEWVGESPDFVAVHSILAGLQPDTILVEESEGKISTNALEILEASSWNVRVVGLSLDDNRLSVYRREQQTVGKSKDLLHLVLGE
jgi:DNA-binding NarL/FixJ family response regulator